MRTDIDLVELMVLPSITLRGREGGNRSTLMASVDFFRNRIHGAGGYSPALPVIGAQLIPHHSNAVYSRNEIYCA